MLCKGFQEQQRRAKAKQKRNKTKTKRISGAKFIVLPSRKQLYICIYIAMCIYVCIHLCITVCWRFMLPTNMAYCCWCYLACCNTINFRFCLSRKVANEKMLCFDFFAALYVVFVSRFSFLVSLIFFIVGCIFMKRKQQLSCQCCSNMTYT